MTISIKIDQSKNYSSCINEICKIWDIRIDSTSDFEFIIENDYLKIIDLKEYHSGVYVDFLSKQSVYRQSFGGGKKQTILKAIGVTKSRTPLNILDATPGLGKDSFVFFSHGCNVHMLERNEIVCALLENGLNKLKNSENYTNKENSLTLEKGTILDNIGHLDMFDVVYLDPMYPKRNKSASVKKEMAMFHKIVGDDKDSDFLLEKAKSLAKKRVVVKRPKGAPFLNSLKPDFEYLSKNTRYDVYI
ncbi:16S rRNA (guanine(1516)-N(2))-methyltransferase [Paraphotobacterium marinum]|uniref:Ribosomal RNA small subunit methyltransferase J n=1 Tax=Paraphotobacterium marinum TaxID=1755811 RepID=A0A220VCP6_9GAMM|nr:class I SAM-dependent methyltransferase [Paraphotobacterium marinum]ASK78164.1 16S rRNA (guanine(1516)-N(2))-methyltransferase [Paraphotobacterium marinum]